MNIWIVNHYAVAPGSSGGTRHYDLARELTKQGCRVTVFASAFEHQAREDLHLADAGGGVTAKEEEIGGIRFVWLKTRSYRRNDWRRVAGMLEFAWRSYRWGAACGETPDIVIGSLMHPFAALAGWALARRKKCLFYFEERDLWPQTLIDFGKVSKYHPVVMALSALELFLYRKAQRIIVLFEKAGDYVAARGIPWKKVIYLPNGVDLERHDGSLHTLPEDAAACIQELGGMGKFLAVYTGSHGISDYLDVLLESAEELKKRNNRDIHFLFVGDGPDKDRLVTLSESKSLPNVTFLAPVPKSAMPALLAKAGAGLISLKDASIYKWGMSFNKLYDYMAARLPTLLLGKSESNIERSGGGLIAADAVEMADALERVAGDAELRAELGRHARAYVETHHAWSSMSGRLLAAMKEDVNLQSVGPLTSRTGKGSVHEHG